MNTPAQCRLSFLHARDVPRSLILRRGPSEWTRAILWHRDSDSFEDGQWFRGSLHPAGSALSPDGRHLLYAASKQAGPGGEVGYHYTVLSRPPWLTALALFPNGLWSGFGGRFLDNTRYVIFGASREDKPKGAAPGLEQVFEAPKDAFNTLGVAHRDGRRVNLRKKDIAWATAGWEVPDPMDAYEIDGGRLCRNGALIRDFTAMTFEPLRAPYDTRTDPEGAPEPWHPLDGE